MCGKVVDGTSDTMTGPAEILVQERPVSDQRNRFAQAERRGRGTVPAARYGYPVRAGTSRRPRRNDRGGPTDEHRGAHRDGGDGRGSDVRQLAGHVRSRSASRIMVVTNALLSRREIPTATP
jgi:hypothetical protein